MSDHTNQEAEELRKLPEYSNKYYTVAVDASVALFLGASIGRATIDLSLTEEVAEAELGRRVKEVLSKNQVLVITHTLFDLQQSAANYLSAETDKRIDAMIAQRIKDRQEKERQQQEEQKED